MDVRQAAILLCIGLQRKSVNKIAKELGLPANQIYALLNKTVRNLSKYFDSVCKQAIESQLTFNNNVMEEVVESFQPTYKSLEDDLREAESEARQKLENGCKRKRRKE